MGIDLIYGSKKESFYQPLSYTDISVISLLETKHPEVDPLLGPGGHRSRQKARASDLLRSAIFVKELLEGEPDFIPKIYQCTGRFCGEEESVARNFGYASRDDPDVQYGIEADMGSCVRKT